MKLLLSQQAIRGLLLVSVQRMGYCSLLRYNTHVIVTDVRESTPFYCSRQRTAMNGVMTAIIELYGLKYVLFLEVWSSALEGPPSTREAAPL